MKAHKDFRGMKIARGCGKLAAISFLIAVSAGCSMFGSSSRSGVGEMMRSADNGRPVPGVEEYVWEEPMVDVITVPPGLDPTGTFWRPAHQEIVEIRQGRWKRPSE